MWPPRRILGGLVAALALAPCAARAGPTGTTAWLELAASRLLVVPGGGGGATVLPIAALRLDAGDGSDDGDASARRRVVPRRRVRAPAGGGRRHLHAYLGWIVTVGDPRASR